MDIYSIDEKKHEAQHEITHKAFERCIARDKTGKLKHLIPLYSPDGVSVIAVLMATSRNVTSYAILKPSKGAEVTWFRSLVAAERSLNQAAKITRTPGYELRVVWLDHSDGKHPGTWRVGTLVDIIPMGNEWYSIANVLDDAGQLHEVRTNHLRVVKNKDDSNSLNHLATLAQRTAEQATALRDSLPRLTKDGVPDRTKLRGMRRRQKAKLGR